MSVLRGPRVTLRPARDRDVPALAAILAEPAVAEWWPRHDARRVRDEIVDGSEGWVVEEAGEVIGWLGYEVEDDPDYAHVAIDMFLATRVHGAGRGREALGAALRHLAATGHRRFTIDPAAGNARAVRAYAAAGFRPVGVLRAHERGPDGRWRDGLLMDLLAEEIPPPA